MPSKGASRPRTTTQTRLPYCSCPSRERKAGIGLGPTTSRGTTAAQIPAAQKSNVQSASTQVTETLEELTKVANGASSKFIMRMDWGEVASCAFRRVRTRKSGAIENTNESLIWARRIGLRGRLCVHDWSGHCENRRKSRLEGVSWLKQVK